MMDNYIHKMIRVHPDTFKATVNTAVIICERNTAKSFFVVEDKVLVEIKAVIQLEDVHLAQALNYLKAYKLEEGLLINFGTYIQQVI